MSDNKISVYDLAKSEYLKCSQDPVHFMKNYIKIQHPIKGAILFNLYKFQEQTLKDFADFKFNIILKSRQMGISTLVAAYCLWVMIFNKDKNILIISLKQDDAKDVVGKVRFANENLPNWLKINCIEDNRLSLKFANGSQIRAASTTKKSGVGQALSLLIIDECALIEEAEELWTSAQPALSTGGKCIALSCVTKDTLIISSNGICEIQDFINPLKKGGYEINNYEILGVNKLRKGNLFHNNGFQKTRILKTKFSELECTLNHKLWAFSQKDKKYGWYESSYLREGDFLSIQSGQKIWGNQDELKGEFKPSISPNIHSPFNIDKLTPEICYLLGLYIAEGSVYKVLNKNKDLIGGSLTITCGDDVSHVFDNLDLKYSCWDGLHYTVSNKNFIEFMEYVGFDLSKKANQKYIPTRLLKMSENNIKYLLKGIFDGDECSTKNITKLTSTSKKLINQVRILLNNFGILSNLYTSDKDKLNKNRKSKIKFNYDPHNLEMTGKNALKFYNLIGFGFNRKQKNESRLKNKDLSRANTKDVIPHSLDLINSLAKSSNLKGSEIERKCGIYVNRYVNSKRRYKTENISKDNVLLLYSLFSNNLTNDEQFYWNNIIHENITWCEIKSIKESENETFDFSLPEIESDNWCHSVIYNGVIGHQTPRGIGNFFHKMYTLAEEHGDSPGVGKNGFHPIKLPWDLHPDRNDEWRRVEGEKQGSAKKAAQEFDCDFLASGDNVIEMSIIEVYKKEYKRDPIEKVGVGHALWKWEYPKSNGVYVVSADVARGDGTDFSAAHVIDISTSTPKQAAEFKAQIGTKDYGNFLVALATEYNDALLIIERENVGWGTVQAVIDRQYKNTFYSSADLKYVDVHRQITNKHSSEEKKLVPGFSTNLRTRPLIISNLEHYFREKAIEIYSVRTISELETFIWKNGKAEAMNGYNDDLIMSLAIGLWVRDTALRLRQEGVELTKIALDKTFMNKTDIQPIYKTQALQNSEKFWQMSTGKSGYGQDNIEDIRWLIS